MTKRIGMEVSLALSEAVKLADVDCVAAYPITPQTHTVEHLSELVADGHLDAEFIPVESEHSAMSVCIGAAAVGARTFTSTAGPGLALMHELLFIASAMRFPIVMAVVNRTLSAPLNIWNDHSDIMASRDCGWIQVFVENGQQAFDQTICAYRIAEDRQVLLPVAVNLDGFSLSHMVEPLAFVSQELVNRFLPAYQPLYTLHPDQPMTMGAFAMPEIFMETKKVHEVALRQAKPVIQKVWDEWANLTGRQYQPIEGYRMEGAEIGILAAGGVCEVAMGAVDRLREQGKAAGLLKLRLWRPFPFEELRQMVAKLKTLVVVDRALSTGGPGGPIFSEVRSALYDEQKHPQVSGFIAGLGGRDVPPEHIMEMVTRATGAQEKKEEFTMIGIRERG
ncbi:MAG: pyruvate ferredoxin oxidoreductase [Deltaproteobacteria bacterium]|nr:pyruvate ferredoxin oxidoreductase [Deltaproteobacteria bacterium]